MQDGEKQSPEQIRAFLEASEEVQFEGKRRQEVYDWITRLLRRQSYRTEGKVVRGLLRRYVAKMTGRSRAQVTRLIGRYLKHSEVLETSQRRHRFESRFAPADIELLAQVDEAETLSGPATKKILEREWKIYRHTEYERLATISAAHIYNLRKRRRYRECRAHYTKTRAVQVAIGERRRPQPGGRPGYLRVDTVHQGDLDGIKGVYHINAVDEVTQWQVVGSVAAITQMHLEPVLRAILSQFPFPIRGFHSDNGSEFINDTVASLLKDLLIEQTKSRPRKSNDNGLVESKNGAVIRKHIGTRPVIFDRELSRCTTPGCLRIAFRRLRSHRRGTCPGHRPVLSTQLQSLPEFSSPVRTAGTDRRFARQREVRISSLRHAVGSAAPTGARFPAGQRQSQTGTQHPGLGPSGGGTQ
jgi:transposase InsO family protein